MKIGDYEPLIQEKDVNEAFIDDIKEGEVFWTVKIDKEGTFDTPSQELAFIMSKLVKIEKMLKRVKK